MFIGGVADQRFGPVRCAGIRRGVVAAIVGGHRPMVAGVLCAGTGIRNVSAFGGRAIVWTCARCHVPLIPDRRPGQSGRHRERLGVFTDRRCGYGIGMSTEQQNPSEPAKTGRDHDEDESDEWIDETMAEGDIANGEGDPDAQP
jgi:hypothetical protein